MSNIIRTENKYVANNYAPFPVVLTKGKGCYLWDEKNVRYIDMMSAYSAATHGHCNPRLVKALTKQANTLCITSRAYYTNTLAPLAEKLCKMSKMDKMLPMNTGAEAVETAIKAARRWGYMVKNIPEKNHAEIIVAKQNFHGRTTTIIGFSTEPEYKKGFGPFTPGFVHVPFNDSAALEKAITPNTCAVLIEPMQGEGGIIIPDKGYLKQVQAICKKHNVLLILDEVQTGLGRTGKLFAYMHEISPPDAVIVGKALGGAMVPISALLGKEHLMQVFTPGSHGSTFGGNPLACAVALEALKIIEEDHLAEHSHKLGKHLLNRLKKIDSKFIKAVRGSGLWVGLELDPKYLSAYEFCKKLIANGILTKDTHHTVIRLAPPLTITMQELDTAIDIIETLLTN